jgi:heptosyltransferase-2
MTGSAVVAVGVEGERDVLDIIGGGMEKRFINIAGRCTVEELVAVLRGARLVIGNDSGPVHISAASGVPTVTVFGSTSPKWTAPRGKSSVVIAGSAECAPCFRRECPEGRAKCLESIEVSDLIEAARRLLKDDRVADKEPAAGTDPPSRMEESGE